MKSTLPGLLFVGMTSAALLGACSKSEGDGDGGSGGSGGENAGGDGGESSGGKGGAASGGKGGTASGGTGGTASGGTGGNNTGGAAGGSGGSSPMGGSGGATMNPLMPAPTVELVVTIPSSTAPKTPPPKDPVKPDVSSEGPVWVAAHGYLLFSDQADGHDNIFKLDPTKPEAMRAEVFPYKLGPTRPKTNGLTIDKDGNVFVCEAIPGAIWKFKPNAGAPGTPELVADKVEGAALGKVNDVAVSKKGVVYFSSAWNGAACPDNMNAAYSVINKVVKRITPSPTGKDGGPRNANGVALSPDERTLYIGDDGCYNSPDPGSVFKYPIAEDGSVGAGVKLIAEVNVPDGIAVDDNGNLYVASNFTVGGHAIFVYKPDGTEWGKIPLPAGAPNPSNVSFGDADRKTLYMTAGGKIYKARLPIPGAP